MPDVLDGELVPVVGRVGVDNVARLVGLLLATQDLLEEVERTKLLGWKVEPHYSVTFDKVLVLTPVVAVLVEVRLCFELGLQFAINLLVHLKTINAPVKVLKIEDFVKYTPLKKKIGGS